MVRIMEKVPEGVELIKEAVEKFPECRSALEKFAKKYYITLEPSVTPPVSKPTVKKSR